MTQSSSQIVKDASEAHRLSRRHFVAGAAAVGLGTASGAASAADLAVVEQDVRIQTASGVCDAAFVHPAAGSYPAVLVWTDAFGLRPAFRELGRRLAAQGYAVLVPNPFYRVARAPVFGDLASFDFKNPADRAKLQPLMGSVTAAGAAESDAKSYVDFLLAQAPVDRSRKMGVQGYCMGGALTLRTAAELPERVGAGASFHGGGLVTDQPNSPHLLAPRIKARLYLAIAASDDAQQPDAKDKLQAAFAAAHVPAQVEVYAGTLHGWCVSDMPQRDGKMVYSRADAERAWGKLLELYKTAIA